MKSSWISNPVYLTLGLVLFLPLLAQEEPQPSEREIKEKAEALQKKESDGEAMAEIFTILRALQPQEATVAIQASSLDESEKNLFLGWAFHQQGRYQEAVKQFDLVDRATLEGEVFLLNRLDELSKTGTALSGFERLETENFIIRFREGPDRVMTYYLPEILEKIYATYSKIFAFERSEKILVELMPDHELFSYASALSRKQIETTGTIALCVENRLVVLTPRRVLQGYEWPDTIAHEFVHYVLTKKSRDHAPLWFQEGVAKYFEAHWHEGENSFLDPGMESLLATAVEKNQFLTIEQMMPSFAALPTAALARQAYAQTASMIDFLVRRKDLGIVRGLVETLRDQPEMDAVLLQNLNMDFATFESTWQDWAKEQGYRNSGSFHEGGVTLLDKDDNASELHEMSLEDDRAKKHMRLGDLLLERQRYQAALKEYRKTFVATQKPNRQMALRMLTCMEALDQAEAMIQFIENQVPFPERDTTMLSYLAEAHIRQDQRVEARAFLQRAIHINPFNPVIFRKILATLDRNQDPELVRKTEEILNILTKPPEQPVSKKDSKS